MADAAAVPTTVSSSSSLDEGRRPFKWNPVRFTPIRSAKQYSTRILKMSPAFALIAMQSWLWVQLSTTVHTEHKFVPVYDEHGVKCGYIHPNLVEAEDEIRTLKRREK